MELTDKIRMEMANTMAVIILKEDPQLVEKIDFENEDAFLEPFLFTYFNAREEYSFPKEMLSEIMQGYFHKKEPLQVGNLLNTAGIAYVPNLGYFTNSKAKIEDIKILRGTSIELVTHPFFNLSAIFRDLDNERLDEGKIEISKTLCNRYEESLTNALQYIRINNAIHYESIEQCCKKVILFRTDPQDTNSFATINAHGIAFLNVYQDDYDEVFFVDDIAHQTGHIILTTLLFQRKIFFLIDENVIVGTLLKNEEYRSTYIILHALYTYYASITCLHDCLKGDCFNGRQEFEAKARIYFYLLKFKKDIATLEEIFSYYKGIEAVFTKEGIELFEMIRQKYYEMSEYWNPIVEVFDLSNQPYNFTYKKFIELNPKND